MNTDKPTCGECRRCIDRDSRSGLCSPPVPAVLKHYLPRVGLDYTWAATCECFERKDATK